MTSPKTGLTIAAYFVLFAVAAMIGGEIFRGDISPWLWEQYRVSAARHGQADALLGGVFYLAFYAIGFIVPYAALSFAIWLRYSYRWSRRSLLINEGSLHTGVFLASSGCLLSFVLLLNAEMAFLRSLPTKAWNGWLLLSVLSASLFFLFAGLKAIWAEVSKTTIFVSQSADIACRCPQCGHAWTFPAERLRTHKHPV